MAAGQSDLSTTFIKRYFSGKPVFPFPVNLEENKKKVNLQVSIHRSI